MKKLILLIPILFIIFIRCTSSDDRTIYTWNANNTEDIHFYKGSPEGGIGIPYDTINNPNINGDSLRAAIITLNFDNAYNSYLYSLMTVEFNGDKIIYRDSASLSTSKTIVSDYLFRNDSLFAIKSDKKYEFVALGNQDELYRLKGFARFKNAAGRDTVISSDIPFDLPSTLNATGINGFTNQTDTVKWVNVKYIFKK